MSGEIATEALDPNELTDRLQKLRHQFGELRGRL